jgi:hypothetical protein
MTARATGTTSVCHYTTTCYYPRYYHMGPARVLLGDPQHCRGLSRKAGGRSGKMEGDYAEDI